MKIYLACPYFHIAPEIRLFRFNSVNIMAGVLMRQGHIVFSPISHSPRIAMAGDLPLGFEYWQLWNESFIKWCDELHILKLKGWEKSKGIKGEIEMALQLNKEIIYIEPHTKQRKLF